MPELVRHERRGALSVVTLARPDHRNAVNLPLVRALDDALRAASADPETRLVLLTAEGEHFSVGDDLKEFDIIEPALDHADAVIAGFQAVTRSILSSSKVHVCAVRGWAIGGAFAWPVNCDLSIWAEDARVLLPESGHGLFVSGGLTHLLPTRCGQSRAFDMMLSGEPISAQRLLAFGLADRLVPATELDDEAQRWCDRLLALPVRSLPAYRRAMWSESRDAVERALAVETAEAMSAVRDPALYARMANWRSRKPAIAI